MPLARTYESWEVRDFMRKSEGSPSPVTGADAHARVLHGGSTDHGKMSSVTTGMHHRTHKQTGESNNQFKNRGGTARTSAFDNLIFQSAAVTQAFNSPFGQGALAVLDDPANAGKKMRLVLEFAGIGESDFMNTGSGPSMKTVHKNDTSVSSVPGAAGVKVIVDKGPATTEPFIQTCFPLNVCAASSYTVTDWGPPKAQIAAG